MSALHYLPSAATAISLPPAKTLKTDCLPVHAWYFQPPTASCESPDLPPEPLNEGHLAKIAQQNKIGARFLKIYQQRAVRENNALYVYHELAFRRRVILFPNGPALLCHTKSGAKKTQPLSFFQKVFSSMPKDTILGRGRLKKVTTASDLASGRKYACYSIEEDQKSTSSQITLEAQGHRLTEHLPGFMRLFAHWTYAAKDGKIKSRGILALATGGTLHRALRTKISDPWRPQIIEQLLLALSGASQYNLQHRDLKPSNLLLFILDPEKDKELYTRFGKLLVKIGDLSSVTSNKGKMHPKEQEPTTSVEEIWTTIAYTPPELCTTSKLITQSRNPIRIDEWSFGIILLLLYHKPPPYFHSKGLSEKEIEESIVSYHPDFRELGQSMGPGTERLLRGTLQEDPRFRWEFGDLLHTFYLFNAAMGAAAWRAEESTHRRKTPPYAIQTLTTEKEIKQTEAETLMVKDRAQLFDRFALMSLPKLHTLEAVPIKSKKLSISQQGQLGKHSFTHRSFPRDRHCIVLHSSSKKRGAAHYALLSHFKPKDPPSSHIYQQFLAYTKALTENLSESSSIFPKALIILDLSKSLLYGANFRDSAGYVVHRLPTEKEKEEPKFIWHPLFPMQAPKLTGALRILGNIALQERAPPTLISHTFTSNSRLLLGSFSAVSATPLSALKKTISKHWEADNDALAERLLNLTQLHANSQKGIKWVIF